MSCTVAIRPKIIERPTPEIVRDAEAWALFLVEHVPANMRHELGRLLMAR